MRCLICKTAEPEPGTTTFTAEREGCAVIVRDVPGRICPHCGEAYFEAEVVRQIERQVGRAVEAGAELTLLAYRAA